MRYILMDILVGTAVAAAVVALGAHMEGKPATPSMYGMAIVANLVRALLLGLSALPLLNLHVAYLYAFVHIAAKFLFSTAAAAVISFMATGSGTFHMH